MSLSFRFDLRAVMVAFRDEAGALRLAAWNDPRPTAELPRVAGEVTRAPVLVTVPATITTRSGSSRRAEHLFVLHDSITALGKADGLTARAVRRLDFLDGLTAADLGPVQRIEEIAEGASRGGRRLSYDLARTLYTPMAAGTHGRLHLFVVGYFRSRLRAPVAEEEATLAQVGYQGRVRYGVLRVGDDGTLGADGERMVLLNRANIAGFGSVEDDPIAAATELGAVGRSLLRGHLLAAVSEGAAAIPLRLRTVLEAP